MALAYYNQIRQCYGIEVSRKLVSNTQYTFFNSQPDAKLCSNESIRKQFFKIEFPFSIRIPNSITTYASSNDHLFN